MLRLLTHAPEPAPEIGAIGPNLTPDSDSSFSCRCTTSNVIDCLPGSKAVNDVRSRAAISGACVRGIIAEMLQDAINKDEKTEKEGKERSGVDKADKAARDVKDKKEAKGVL